MKRFFLFLLLASLFYSGCNSDNPVSDTDKNYPGLPAVSDISPSIAVSGGFVYILGSNFGSDTSSGVVKIEFHSVNTGTRIPASVVAISPTKISVRVPTAIDTTGASTIKITTPKGSVEDSTKKVYGVSTSAFGNAILEGKGLLGRVYQLPTNTSQLPNFDTMQVLSKLIAPNLNITERSFSSGFPGVPGGLVEWFGIKFEGLLNITTEGTYAFRIASDDGSKLYLDDSLLINDDGVHGLQSASGSKLLKAGTHKLRVDYFQGPRYEIGLLLYWTVPNTTTEVILPADNILLPDISTIFH